MMNSGREWDWMDSSYVNIENFGRDVQIEEILTEANAYSLRVAGSNPVSRSTLKITNK